MTPKNLVKSGDYSSSFNHHVYQKIQKGYYCLDVGCWTGNLGEKLIEEKNCIVDGIDGNEQVIKSAKKVGYRKVYLINLDYDKRKIAHLSQKYDIVIFADVLEHLINPEALLNALKKNIKSGGKIIISVPNVAFIVNRLELLFGRWVYREFGTLDKTHLRFYTIKSIAKLVDDAGYKIIDINPYNQFGILRYLGYITKLFPSLFAYQIMIIAKPK